MSSALDDINTKLLEISDAIKMNGEEVSTQSSKDVGEAIRSLQFEDIVTQLVADAQRRLDEMNLLVRALDRHTHKDGSR